MQRVNAAGPGDEGASVRDPNQVQSEKRQAGEIVIQPAKSFTELTQARLRELLDYDPGTGFFRWRVAAGRRVKVGDVAGRIGNRGYRVIGVCGRRYLAHRLAFLWMTGEFPPDQVDHINGRRDDNRWANLRPATCSQNQQNRGGAQRNSTSGLIGVYWHKGGRKWQAMIKADGRGHHLGYFPTPEEAHAVYVRAKAALHPFSARIREAA